MSDPGYWPYESSGRLEPVVRAYLKGERLSPEQIATMRAYLRQWIMATVWDKNPHAVGEGFALLDEFRARVNDLTDQPAIDNWLFDVTAWGMDPL